MNTDWHGYVAIEDLNLNPTQRQTLISAIRALGPIAHYLPDRRNHWRTRNDNRAAIFEALFDEDALTIAAFKNRLAAIFAVDAETIDHAVINPTFAARPTPVVTFSRGGTDYLCVALFGGPSASWLASAAEARAYLAQNTEEWEEDTP